MRASICLMSSCVRHDCACVVTEPQTNTRTATKTNLITSLRSVRSTMFIAKRLKKNKALQRSAMFRTSRFYEAIKRERRAINILLLTEQTGLPNKCCGLPRGRGAGGGGGFLHVFLVPRQVTLHAVALVTRSLDAVILVRVNYQLCVDAKTPQRLIHLLATLHGHVEIAFTTEKQSWRLNPIGVQERIRDFLVRLPRLRIPRRPDFEVVLNDVLVGAVERDRERSAGPAGCAFEARVAGDEIVRQNPAIAPTAHAQLVG